MTMLAYIYLCCWFFTNFQPLMDLTLRIASKHRLLQYVYNVISCQYCLTLWTTLFITFNPLYALALSCVAQIHKKYLESQ